MTVRAIDRMVLIRSPSRAHSSWSGLRPRATSGSPPDRGPRRCPPPADSRNATATELRFDGIPAALSYSRSDRSLTLPRCSPSFTIPDLFVGEVAIHVIAHVMVGRAERAKRHCQLAKGVPQWDIKGRAPWLVQHHASAGRVHHRHATERCSTPLTDRESFRISRIRIGKKPSCNPDRANKEQRPKELQNACSNRGVAIRYRRASEYSLQPIAGGVQSRIASGHD